MVSEDQGLEWARVAERLTEPDAYLRAELIVAALGPSGALTMAKAFAAAACADPTAAFSCREAELILRGEAERAER
jgi:hypothetical protein